MRSIPSFVSILSFGGLVWLANGSIIQAQTERTSAPSTVKTAINPALIYWQGLANFTELGPEESAFLTKVFDDPSKYDATRAEDMLAAREAALKRLKRGAESTAPCDWGLTVEDGPFTVLPHLGRMLALNRLALLKAVSHFERDEQSEALAWILTVHRSARHCASGGFLVGFLTQSALENSALQLTGRYAAKLDAAVRAGHLDTLAKLPRLHSSAEGLEGEHVFADWCEKQATDSGALLKAVAQLQDTGVDLPSPDQGSTPAAQMTEAKVTVDEMLRWAREQRHFLDEAKRVLSLPWEEGQKAIGVLETETPRDNPFLRTLRSSLRRLAEHDARSATMRSMVEAALTHGAALNETLSATYKDAFTGQPLRFRKEEASRASVLFSATLVRKKEVRLIIDPAPPLPVPVLDKR